MTNSKKIVSIIVESSATDLSSSHTGVLDTLASLQKQDYPLENIEIIICQYGWDAEKHRAVTAKFPSVKILTGENSDYYYLKNLGIQEAQGEIIAFADSDCVYVPTWASGIVITLEKNADVSVGISNYPGSSLIERLCAFHNFHCILPRESDRIRRFVSNNVAFKAEVIKSNQYDRRFIRSGGCTQLAERLYRAGMRMKLNPEQLAHHNFYDLRTHIWERTLRNGYDIFHTRTLDSSMPLAPLAQIGIFAPPLFWGIFVLSDTYNIIQNIQYIHCRWYEVPVFLGFSVMMRSLEVVGMYWKLFNDRSLESYLGKA
ncbi:MAG TPA: glycosyltransferase [Bacteroidota bacterium]